MANIHDESLQIEMPKIALLSPSLPPHTWGTGRGTESRDIVRWTSLHRIGLILVAAVLLMLVAPFMLPAVEAQGVVPAKPQVFIAAAGPDFGQATLYWANPDDPSITKYQYQYKESPFGSYDSWLDIPGSKANTTTHTITGLASRAYSFRVRAVNDVGPSRPSAEGMRHLRDKLITVSTDTTRVAEGDAGRTDIAVTVTLSQAAPSGGLPFEFYVSHISTVTNNAEILAPASCDTPSAHADLCYPDGPVVWVPEGTTSASYTLSILGDTTAEDEEILYLDGFSVHARDTAWAVNLARIFIEDNDQGASAKSGVSPSTEDISPTPTAKPPTEPRVFIAAAGPDFGQATLYWANPDDPSITKYQYQYKESPFGSYDSWLDIPGSKANTTTHTITGLASRAYSFRVRAVNDVGPSRPSAEGMRHLRDKLITVSTDTTRVVEGNAGRTDIAVTVTLSQAAPPGGLPFEFYVSHISTVTNNAEILAPASCDTPSAHADLCYPDGPVVWVPEGTTSASYTLSILGDTTAEDEEILYLDGFSVHARDTAWAVNLARIFIEDGKTSANEHDTTAKKTPFPVRNLRVDTSIQGQVTIIWRSGKVGGGNTQRCRRAEPQLFYYRLDNLTQGTLIADGWIEDQSGRKITKTITEGLPEGKGYQLRAVVSTFSKECEAWSAYKAVSWWQ